MNLQLMPESGSLQTRFFLVTCLCIALSQPAHAGLRDWFNSLKKPETQSQSKSESAVLSDKDISQGLKQALSVGAERAITLLAKKDGYLGDGAIRIPLPDSLQTLAKGMRTLGQGDLVDEFELTMNRAAEQAIGKTLSIVSDTVRDMTLQDVRSILQGSDDAATRYLQDKAGVKLQEAVHPIVANATEKAGATQAYKKLQSTMSNRSIGRLLDTSSFDLDNYVTDKALQGFYYKLAAEEQKIRQDPIARSTELLKQVFGSR